MLFPETTIPSVSASQSYLVFARKYRPQNFQELIGQNHLVDILTNAFDKDRIAHAYILTGVRGVGKTTTARIIAKGLNCTANDKPTVNPCGECNNCVSITAGKNIDVFEMDAASRTGIDDIREIIDSIPYKPLNCRYKVYIIDEVHMLSKAAFNGLLKTLEEPPSHVKFIFATTEIHKVLPTILSRCQKIDLKRVDIKTLSEFFAKILTVENIPYDDIALAKIARSSDGSVRDGLSLLDQAVAAGAGSVTVDVVSQMLGAAQGDDIINIIAECLAYQPANALRAFHKLYETGFDCYLFVKELLRTTEWLVRLKFTPDIANDASLNEDFVAKTVKIAQEVDVHLLSRMWDIALKATQDIKIAPDAKAVCEMALIRMNYGLALPDPAMMYQKVLQSHDNHSAPLAETDTEKKNTNLAVTVTPEAQKKNNFNTIHDVLKILSDNKELDLITLLEMKSIIHAFKQGYIQLSATSTYHIESKDIQRLKTTLDALTECAWQIDIKKNLPDNTDHKSIFDIKKAHKNNLIEEAQNDKIIKAILETMPSAKIIHVTEAIALPNTEDLLNSDSDNHNSEIEE